MTEAEDKSSKVNTLKKRISEELNVIDKDIKNMEKSKKDSVERIEIKKVELKKFSNTQDICDEHYATLQEIEQASKLIEERKVSITTLDSTIANLDLQIAKIQAEHDKAVADLDKKRRKLNDYLKYYEDLNDKLEKLIKMLGEEELKHCLELNNLKAERAKTLARTDLSENALNKLLGELDNKMVDLNKEHGKLIDSISQKLSEITVDVGEVEELLSEGTKKQPPKKKKEPEAGGRRAGDFEAVESEEETETTVTEEEQPPADKETEPEGKKPKKAYKPSVLEPEPESKEKKVKPKAKPKPKEDQEPEAKIEELEEEEILLIKEEPSQPQVDDDYSGYDSDETDYQQKKPKTKGPKDKGKGKKKGKKKPKAAEYLETPAEDDDSFDFDDEELLDWFSSKEKKLSKDLRLDLLRQGFQITPSDRIITQDDRILTLEEARRLGILDLEAEEEESEGEYAGRRRGEKKKKGYDKQVKYYQSPASSASSLGKESSESHICGRDIEYLKVVFGKSLTIALAEITAIQPADPVHYLAHWMLKYRYNQEIDQVTRIQIQELMIEQERLAAEKWHRELQEEARLAVLEALFRAENIIIQQDFQSELQLREYEGEFDDTPQVVAAV